MRAAVVTRYGPPEVVEIREVPTPEPGDDEVLIRAHATAVNSGDARIRALRVPRGMAPMVRMKFGFSAPKQPILGFDTAGEVEAVGRAVTEVQPGDRVVASRGFDFGCHAENVVVAQDGAITAIPDGMSYQDAVAILFGGATSLLFFEMGKLTAGESLLVNGASGAVGTMAVQIAKHRGAEVTAVCSGVNADLVSDLGADHVVDYTKDDITGSADRFDVVMDNHGNMPYRRAKGLLKPGGRFLMVVGDLAQTVAATWQKPVITAGMSSDPTGFYPELLSLARNGVLRPVVDAVLPFDQIVEAHRRVDSGRKVGSLVLSFDGDP